MILAFERDGKSRECEVVLVEETRLVVADDLAPGNGDKTLDGARLLIPGAEAILLGPLDITAHNELAPRDAPTRANLWRVQRGFAGAARSPAVSAPLPRMPVRGHQDERGRLERLQWVRAQTGTLLAPLSQTRLCAERLTANIEYLIGAVEIPVGVAGPLLVRGQAADGLFYAPLATTEGALVASCARGALALSRAGGVRTRVVHQRMTRVPMFVMGTSDAALLFAAYVRDHLAGLREQVALVSAHARLVSVEPDVAGAIVNVPFVYETGDAAGQNMTTACTWQACQWLLRELAALPGVTVDKFVIESNMSGDKKVTYQSMLVGRGLRVTAECVLGDDVLDKVLGATADDLVFFHGLGMSNAAQTGMVGYNCNVANIVAAIFTATGQDIACVHESSLGVFSLHRAEGGVRASLTLPSLVVGTVGGGTHLPAQHALLEMLGCAGAGNARRLGELICAFSLALEISTLSAVATGEFASAHDRMGRNRPVRWFSRADLTPAFFAPALQTALADPDAAVSRVESFALSSASGILSELTTRKLKKLVGIEPVRLFYRHGGEERFVDAVVKAKALADETMLMMDAMVLLCDKRAWATWQRLKERTQFAGTHVRELGVCAQTDARFVAHAPRVYHALCDPAREAYVLVLERLSGLHLMDSADDVRGFSRPLIERALEGIAAVHAIWLGRERELLSQPWLGLAPSTSDTEAMRDLFDAFYVHAAAEMPELVGDAELALARQLLDELGRWWPDIEHGPRTLAHNDFNPRNIAFRDERGALTLCAYDWELATLHAPQRDLAELLAFVLSPSASAAEIEHYVEHHRCALEAASGARLDRRTWYRGYVASLRDFFVNRLGFYLVGQTFRHYAFLPRLFRTTTHLVRASQAA